MESSISIAIYVRRKDEEAEAAVPEREPEEFCRTRFTAKSSVIVLRNGKKMAAPRGGITELMIQYLCLFGEPRARQCCETREAAEKPEFLSLFSSADVAGVTSIVNAIC